jgi:hypothetical protein
MVNTFIITENLSDTFKLLDSKKLGKQRLEAKQIIEILERIDNGEDITNIAYASHPAAKMWIGYTNALKAYYNLCVFEWINRGYNNTMKLYPIEHNKFKNLNINSKLVNQYNYPRFASFLPFINSHKAALIRNSI